VRVNLVAIGKLRRTIESEDLVEDEIDVLEARTEAVMALKP
jgi:hypothetical protein